MKTYVGYPVEIIIATVDDRDVEVGVTYQWANGMRRTRWYDEYPRKECANLRRIPYEDCA